MSQKQIENRALIVTTAMNAVIAAAGVWVYLITGLHAMFLDGFFSAIALLSSVIAMLISKLSPRKTKHYPHGLYFLEPLYAVFKSALLIGMMIYAVLSSLETAIGYFFYDQGTVMNTGPIPLYAVTVAALCLGLAFFNRRQYKKTNSTSTMLRAEAQTNLIDGLQSLGIGAAVALLRFIPLDSMLGFLHYTGDFFIVSVLVAISIKDPIIILCDSFRELTGGITKDKDICGVVSSATGLAPSEFMVYKTGMRIKVCIPASEKTKPDAKAKEDMLQIMRRHYESAEIEYIL